MTKEATVTSLISKISGSPGSTSNIFKCHFAIITKLLPPLQTTELPAYLPLCPLKANISEREMYQHFERIAKSRFPDPLRLLQQFAAELADDEADYFK